MNNKLAPLIEKTQASFWFIPSLMMIFSLFLAAVSIYIDVMQPLDVKSVFSILYQTDVSAVRSLLATIAAAMITVTSIAFSITIVTLTLASSQFGPRLMRNFMMDKATQFVLGSFIATFVFCILLFCALSFQAPFAFKPGISVALAIALTCFSIWILIFFIHHVATSIQADVVIDGVFCELQKHITALFPKTSGEAKSHAEQFSAQQKQDLTQHQVLAPVSGYLQLIDQKCLLELATESKCIIELHYLAGNFIVENAVVATVYAKHDMQQTLAEDITQHIVLGAFRTPVQDPEFAVHQLVEIALRALSPGINDPYTAITCIDKLTAVLCTLTDKDFPPTHIFVEQQLRVINKRLAFSSIATAAFDQIRQQGQGNLAVTIRMLDCLYALATQAKSSEQVNFVNTQTEMIQQQQLEQSISECDREQLVRRIKRISHYTQSR
ncbi:Uncharacterized membrane protein [Colwellia chukchiensis]|uniref:Uncharacterized membrane protein n=1 Tax=Colwellia chukchiensis TaxID=641665 RepID=A0A1H7PCF7_9GAMM|nr:DUF2254 domain-containing protein [Colwellia chukchiensis]SEL33138.1 Uncharacterized membrane protein [Colwellia chukchiensis]